MARLYSNNYTSTLAFDITSGATSAVVTNATGLPTITGSDYYYLTLAAGGVIEIVKVTARTGTSLTTIVRAQESTTAVAWPAGTIVSLRATAESFTSGTTGATSSTDNAVARFDGTTGKIIQNSVVTVSDTGAMAGVTDLTATGNVDLSGASGLKIPTSATPTVDANGEIALDTTITDHKGLIKYYSGEEMVIPAMPIANLTAVDGYVVTYDAATDSFKMALGGGGGSLSNVVEDTTPQLGGDLDVNGYSLVSVTNGNINIKPNGTGAINLGGNATQPVELRFLEDSDNGTNYVGFKAPSTLAANKVWTLPSADGSTGQFLKTDGSGNLSFDTVSGGGGGTTTVLTLLSSQTAATSATLDFTGLSDYAYVMFVINDLIPATDNQRLYMRTSTDNGATWDSGASDYEYANQGITNAGTAANIVSTGDSEIELCAGVGNATGESVSGTIYLYNPAGTGYAKVTGQTCCINAVTDPQVLTIAAARMTGADVDAVRFLFASGNITSGTIYAYGLRKSNSGSSGINDGDYGDVTISGTGTAFKVNIGYTTTATAAGTTTLTSSSTGQQFFTGSTTQTVVLPVTSTLELGQTFEVTNLSSGVVTVQSSGANTIQAMAANTRARFTCISLSGTGTASWSYGYLPHASDITGTGGLVRATSPTLITPVLGTPGSGTLTNCTGLPASTGITGQLPLANGGTGANLTDPNADRIMFWDDSAGAVTWLTATDGLSISGTNLRGGKVCSFKVYRNALQNITATTHTKVQLNSEIFDTDSTFDSTTNYRHTPTIAGKYLYIGGMLFISPSDQGQMIPELYKNGSVIFQASVTASGTAGILPCFSCVIDMNGSTDYVELYCYRANTGDIGSGSAGEANLWMAGFYLGT